MIDTSIKHNQNYDKMDEEIIKDQKEGQILEKQEPESEKEESSESDSETAYVPFFFEKLICSNVSGLCLLVNQEKGIMCQDGSDLNNIKYFSIIENKKLNYDKQKVRDCCLATSHDNQEFCIIQANLQSHQLQYFIDVGIQKNQSFSHKNSNPVNNTSEHITTVELPEAKIKGKRIFFNSLWNSYFLIDYDENLFQLEFFSNIYFQNYWVGFKYMEEVEEYIEKEDEFDTQKLYEKKIDIKEQINQPKGIQYYQYKNKPRKNTIKLSF